MLSRRRIYPGAANLPENSDSRGCRVHRHCHLWVQHQITVFQLSRNQFRSHRTRQSANVNRTQNRIGDFSVLRNSRNNRKIRSVKDNYADGLTWRNWPVGKSADASRRIRLRCASSRASTLLHRDESWTLFLSNAESRRPEEK